MARQRTLYTFNHIAELLLKRFDLISAPKLFHSSTVYQPEQSANCELLKTPKGIVQASLSARQEGRVRFPAAKMCQQKNLETESWPTYCRSEIFHQFLYVL